MSKVSSRCDEDSAGAAHWCVEWRLCVWAEMKQQQTIQMLKQKNIQELSPLQVMGSAVPFLFLNMFLQLQGLKLFYSSRENL